MPAYSPYAVAGTQAKLTVAGSPVLIPGVETLSGPGGSKPEIDVTAISDSARKKLGGTPDFGSVKFDLAYDPNDATHIAIYTSYSTQPPPDTLTVAYPTLTGTHTITMSGTIVGFSWTFAKDAAIKVSVDFRLLTQPTIV